MTVLKWKTNNTARFKVRFTDEKDNPRNPKEIVFNIKDKNKNLYFTDNLDLSIYKLEEGLYFYDYTFKEEGLFYYEFIGKDNYYESSDGDEIEVVICLE